ncbi:hypothetical protein COOONC_06091 [Cooperia oncophora]
MKFAFCQAERKASQEEPIKSSFEGELWEYEVVEFFFANNRDQYIEVEVGPHGHWLCLLFDGIRKPFNNGEELELEISNKFVGSMWHCEFEIPLAYLPGNITKFNSFAIHGTGNERVYEALNPVTDGNFKVSQFQFSYSSHFAVVRNWCCYSFRDIVI